MHPRFSGLSCCVVSFVVAACGASVRRTQISYAYFERCYAADFNSRVLRGEKEECWSAWLAYYSMGHASARVAYAHERAEALALGDGTLPLVPNESGTEIPRDTSPLSVSGVGPDVVESLPERSQDMAEPFTGAAGPQRPHRRSRTRADTECDGYCRSLASACASECTTRPCIAQCESEQRICRTGCL